MKCEKCGRFARKKAETTERLRREVEAMRLKQKWRKIWTSATSKI